jgi:hypothetical protein
MGRYPVGRVADHPFSGLGTRVIGPPRVWQVSSCAGQRPQATPDRPDSLAWVLDESLPRHLQSVPPPESVQALRRVLDELATRDSAPAFGRANRARARIQAVLREWPLRPEEQPSLAQIVEHRLMSGCWTAWVRDAKNRFPGFGTQRTPEAAPEPGRSSEIRYPAPWPEWFQIEDRIWQLLSLRYWRGKLMGEGHDVVEAEEELAGVPVLGRALGAILQPWLEGRVPGVPRLLQARGSA